MQPIIKQFFSIDSIDFLILLLNNKISKNVKACTKKSLEHYCYNNDIGMKIIIRFY